MALLILLILRLAKQFREDLADDEVHDEKEEVDVGDVRREGAKKVAGEGESRVFSP